MEMALLRPHPATGAQGGLAEQLGEGDGSGAAHLGLRRCVSSLETLAVGADAPQI